jgi:hypothetical protein
MKALDPRISLGSCRVVALQALTDNNKTQNGLLLQLLGSGGTITIGAFEWSAQSAMYYHFLFAKRLGAADDTRENIYTFTRLSTISFSGASMTKSTFLFAVVLLLV